MGQYAAQSIRRAETKIQQLCCLGLGDQVLMPAVLETLHDIIPSHNNVFFWSDASGQIVNLYNESSQAMELATLYYHEFYNNLELEVFKGWQPFILSSNHAMDFDELLSVERRKFLNHSFYNEFLAKIDFHWGLQVVIREGDNRYGSLGLCRTAADRAFTRREARLLDRLSTFIAHGMVQAPEQNHRWMDSGNEGYLIADRQGRICWSSESGQKFLYLATCEKFSPSQSPYRRKQLPAPLLGMCRTLDAIAHDRPCTHPPVWESENAWGRFRFRAHWLEPGTEQNPLIGITVRRQIPLPLKLMRRIQNLPLTPKQGQVCLLMATGKSYREIAARLDISENTAISHSRAIYGKLDVSNRTGLISQLLDS